MSSYLNFYLVPKKKKSEEPNNSTNEEVKPLHFLSYCRNSNVYQNFWEVCNPPFIGMDDEYNYGEVTSDDVQRVIASINEDIKKAEDSLENTREAFNSIEKPSIEFMNDYTSDYVSRLSYIDELKEAKSEVQSILGWISDIKYSDFEKVLFNID